MYWGWGRVCGAVGAAPAQLGGTDWAVLSPSSSIVTTALKPLSLDPMATGETDSETDLVGSPHDPGSV